MIREPTQISKSSSLSHSYSGKGKGILIEEPEEDPLKDLPFHFWPKEKQLEFNEATALRYQEKENQAEQELLEKERLQAEKEALVRKEYEEWEAEKIRIDADVELSKLVKIEEQEVPEFDVGAWLREFTAKKQKEAAAAIKRRKIVRGPTPLQRRKGYEQYLKNMKGWKLVQLKNKYDSEVF